MPVFRASEFAVCGISTTFILFAVGASCLGVAIWSYVQQGGINCGQNGKPPLLEWILGTGISYLIIACAYSRVKQGNNKTKGLGMFIVSSSHVFIFAWMIVGAVSLWRDGTDCEQVNSIVWKMGLSAVIISIILCLCGGYMFNAVYTDEEMGGR
ncbi:hypothetical protein IV203_022541 [Nitzschia inconspicua]|uniref:Uncharacterized protein n=1 Tax=Nitzschia inconspicua TaxID=303405 RepID=A0A9K3PEK3_9STRA|nr:hypothetical protein IV203_022541 [Nitzschia inconspicua]